MTLGADVAPAATRAEFLAAWRLTHDAGMFLGPLSLGAAAIVAPLSLGLGVLGDGLGDRCGDDVALHPAVRALATDFAPSPAVRAGEGAQIARE